MKNKTVEIIFVRYNLPEIEKKSLEFLDKFTKYPYILTDFDNYINKERLSVVWNRLIKRSKADIICLLNSDVYVTLGWLTNLVKVFSLKSDAGIIGPSTDHTLSIQRTVPTFKEAQSHKGEIQQVIDLSGFCYLFPRKIWEEVGGFNEDFYFYGQEQAFSRKVKKAGHKLYWVKYVFVNHVGSASALAAEKRGEINYKKIRNRGHVDWKKWREKNL